MMAKKIINVGKHPLKWERVNSAVTDINDNFDELYGNIDLGAVSKSIIPDTDVTYDLGSDTYRFKDLYLSGSTIKLGDATISATVGGGITVPGGVTSTVITSGITVLIETPPIFINEEVSWFFDDGEFYDNFPSVQTVTIPAAWATADVYEVYLNYTRISTDEELFNRQLTPGEYTINGNSMTINVGVPNVNVRGSFTISAYNTYFVNEPWTAPVGSLYGPFPEGAEIAANGYDLANPPVATPVWDIQLDGSDFLSSITMLSGGTNYLSYGTTTDNLIISASYAPSTVITFDSPVLYVNPSTPRIIASTSDNPGQFATPGPFTASWTDGTRSVSIDYEVITYMSNGLTLEYLRLVSDSSYSITGTFTGSNLVSDGVFQQYPQLNFVIDPADPTELLRVVDWGTLQNFTGPLIRFPITGHVLSVLPIGGVIGEITVSTTSGVSSKAVAPSHSYGEFGDKAGMIAWDGTYLYYCTADYVDDLTDVWIRVEATDTSW
jgi:hypothetical protein